MEVREIIHEKSDGSAVGFVAGLLFGMVIMVVVCNICDDMNWASANRLYCTKTQTETKAYLKCTENGLHENLRQMNTEKIK